MAYTSIIPVYRLDNSLRYIRDPEKITEKAKKTGSLEDAIGEALDRNLTEGMVYEDSIGCTCASAFEDMVATKVRFHKQSGVQGYHLIQSFAAGEVTPGLAHLIGMELAERLLKGEFETVITTHLNTGHYHNHIVFNSVSMSDGQKYRSNAKSYYKEVRQASDELCRKYGLSVIAPKGNRGKQYSEWKAEQEGKPTWRTAIRMDIRDAIQESFTWRQFIAYMEQKGYQWKLDRKYVSLSAPGMQRFVRLKSLGKSYTEEAIREQLLRPRSGKTEQAVGRTVKKKLHGLQALYYSYLYQMGALRNKPKYIPYQVRQDIWRLDERIEQMEFLQSREINSREELLEFQEKAETKIQELVRERQSLYRLCPRPERIARITEELKPLRKEVRMCVKILKHSIDIERQMAEAEQAQIKNTQEKQKKREKERG